MTTTVVILVLLYFVLQYKSPAIVELMHVQGNWQVLNQICGVSENKTLDFYQGLMMDRLWGPLLQVISGAILVIVSLRWLKHSNWIVFAGALFVYFFITKFEVLFYPVYGESGGGPVAEAVWLYRNHFDYARLLEQPNVDQGGPKVYLASLYPAFVALLLKCTPSVKAFLFLYHSLMFLCGALTLSFFREILLKFSGKEFALLGSLVLLFLPLFQSMVEVVNMEMLCLFFAVLAALFLIHKNIFWAAVMATLSAWIKGPGAIACAGVFAVACLLLFVDKGNKDRFKNLIWATLSLLLGYAPLYVLKTYVSPVQATSGTIKPFIGWAPLSGSKALLILFVLSVIGYLAVLIREWKTERKEKLLIGFVGLIFSSLWFGLYLNVSVMGPRYKLLLAPFLILGILFTVHAFVRSERMAAVLLITALFLSCLGSYGLYHPDKIKSYTYAFNELERSLEYRNDIKLDRKLAETMERKYSSMTIGAPFVIAQQLALPELGYVSKPLDVMIYGFHLHYGNIKNFHGLAQLDHRQLIWIGFPNEKRPLRQMEYPIHSAMDIILQNLEVGDKEVSIFRGGYAIEAMRVIYEQQYREKLKKRLGGG